MPTEPTSPDPSPTTWERLDRLLPDHTWDWPGWLPRGFLTILASEPGAGKSLLCLRLAATYLDGRPWPDGTRPDSAALEARSLPGAPRRILWCETEAGHDLNLNRARHWGLDLSRIISPLSSPLHNFKIDNNDHGLAFFRLSCDRTVRLVVLDSLRGLHSRPGSAAAIQAILSLSDLARIARKPFILTHHLRKRTYHDQDGRPTLDRLRGSGLITQTARVVWTLDTPDLARPDHHRLSMIKNWNDTEKVDTELRWSQ